MLRRLHEWALRVNRGMTYEDPGPINLRTDLVSFEEGTRPIPTYRTRAAMISYAKARNAYRWKRLGQDYAWLKGVMEEMGMNPEDAKHLL